MNATHPEHCSACRRRARAKATRSPEELPAKVKRVTRTIDAIVRSIESDADFTGPEDLALLDKQARSAEVALGTAVRAMREVHGYSWTDVGHALGTSRQAAQQRFARYMTQGDVTP